MDMSAAEVKRAASAQPHPSSPQADPNGSEILVRCLQAENVKYLWGYPGGAVLYIYDALYKQDSIQHVLVRHEQAAVHAADGYARATGDVGVALALAATTAAGTPGGAGWGSGRPARLIERGSALRIFPRGLGDVRLQLWIGREVRVVRQRRRTAGKPAHAARAARSG